MSKQYEKEFKENAVKYRNDHPDLTVKDCAKNLGIPYDTLNGWVTAHKNKGENAFRGSGNYSSDEAKEIPRLRQLWESIHMSSKKRGRGLPTSLKARCPLPKRKSLLLYSSGFETTVKDRKLK